MKALTLWQPMAWAIAQGHKPVENRPWPLPKSVIGQPVALHAGLRYDEGMAAEIRKHFSLDVPSKNEITLGAVIAVITFVGCIQDTPLVPLRPEDLPETLRPRFEAVHNWFSGPYGFLIDDVRTLREPVPCRGAQGLWTLSPETLQGVHEELSRPLSDDDFDAIAKATLTDVATQAALIAVGIERTRCLAVIRARAGHWRSSGNGLVASALDHLAEEIARP